MLAINRLKASFVRNLQDLEIQPAGSINYFYGPNASGKTSVLEAVYLLSRVKSFRSSRINNVITHGQKTLSVFAQGELNKQPFTTGVEKGHGQMRLKYNGEQVQSASEQARSIPVFLLAPDHNLLFYDGPKQRRHWLDWSLFHVEPGYLDKWKSYHRAVRHRNALLKAERGFSNDEILGWERMMAEEAGQIDMARKAYLETVSELLSEHYLPLLLDGAAEVRYRNSICGAELLDTLAHSRQDDKKRGFTAAGPHRADISFVFSDIDVAKHLSRGQIKLYGAGLVSAQLAVLKQRSVGAIMLVDDIDAELDSDASRKILDLLINNEAQTFVSSLELPSWAPFDDARHAVFHVKQGRVEKVQ